MNDIIEQNWVTSVHVSDETKIQTFDQLVGHLAHAAKTDPRPRERARASLALRTITAWATQKEQTKK
jgi:hypothetical protein